MAAFSTTLTLSVQMRGINGRRPPRLLRLVCLHWLPKCILISAFLCEAPNEGQVRMQCSRCFTEAMLSLLGVVGCVLVPAHGDVLLLHQKARVLGHRR